MSFTIIGEKGVNNEACDIFKEFEIDFLTGHICTQDHSEDTILEKASHSGLMWYNME